jgi:N-acetylmuramoyl-L-alanine amidase
MNKNRCFECFSNHKRIAPLIIILSLLLTSAEFINSYAGDDSGKLKVVVIDAGHGGKDPGALGKNYREKDITLGVALKLGKIINDNQKDIKVIFTRVADTLPPLHERAEIANRNNADLFISIHANANQNKYVYGSETYAMGIYTNEKNLEVAKKENAVITFEKDYSTHYEGYDPNSAESFIIFTLVQNTYLEQSLEFASIIQNEFVKVANRSNRGVKQAGFLVLWKTTMPSILIETGYISNPNEEKYLGSDEGQQSLAQAIYKAFIEYKAQIESKSSFKKSSFSKSTEPDQRDTFQGEQEADSIAFKIQILASVKQIPLKSTELKKCNKIPGHPIPEEYVSNNTYKYLVGSESSYKNVMEYHKKIKKYFPKSFIVATRNGKIIPINDVLKKINN